MRTLGPLTLLGFVIAACQSSSQSGVIAGVDGGEGIVMTVQLVELSQNPTPTGLPLRFAISATRFPQGSERTGLSWRALDGTATPRDGGGSMSRDADGRLVIDLTASGRPIAQTLTLAVAISGNDVVGDFSDRLYFRRAGRVVGERR